jgi:GT2 family glycosyltransferase
VFDEANRLHKALEDTGIKFDCVASDILGACGRAMLDALVAVGLSPWVVRSVRFDESLGQLLHGYDFDFCLQVRAAGRKVVTADVRMVHHPSLELASDPEGWVDAHMKIAEKWDGRMPQVGVAGGERAAARAQAISTQLQTQARALQHERALKEATESIGWRITAPFRWANRLRTHGRRRRS